MGGHESKVEPPAPVQSFSASEAIPAKVRFSPELLAQLQGEQEARFMQRRVPQRILLEQEDPAIEEEKKRRLMEVKKAIQEKQSQRAERLEEEKHAVKELQDRMDEIQSKYAPKVIHRRRSNVPCRGESEAVLGDLREARNIYHMMKALKQYETCVNRLKAEKSSSS